METFDYSGQEEYIWAMRTRLYSEDADDWKERRMSDVSTDYMSKQQDQKTGMASSDERRMSDVSTDYMSKQQDQKTGMASSDEYNTKVLASLVPDEIIFDSSLVPDEIIFDCNDYTHRPYDACLLFGDVSGFTDLCEKYNKTGKGGPSRLTHVLNSYIGTMVQEIMSYNGDVLKFSGDAFLAMWKSSTNDSMQDCVHQALDCALVIQKTHGKYETDVGVFLRVKLAISAGFVIFSLIGDLKTSHYIVVGQPIFDVKQAEKKSSAGDIIVCHTAWNYLNPSEYLSEYMEDGLHIKVHGLGANWRSTQKSYKHQKALDEEETDSKTNLHNMNEEFSIRPSVNEAVKMRLKEDLRKYIIPPVMRGIDMDEPLEYLTEMRQIVILFINVVTKRMPINDFVNLIDTCYKIVCRTTERMEGCVNKVSLFDKDLMFVVIFGFRGFKHELDSQIGLRCATECYHQINCQPNVRSTSIGVTTGMTYCGVVGHTLRREYTVISLTVNKAARLMCAYPNKVTCDRETFLHSKLQATNFILQEFKHLKGITKAGPVYEFKEATLLDYREPGAGSITRYPILGRDNEMRLYLKLLTDCQEIFEQKIGHVHGGLKMLSHHNTLILSGEARQGKKRLLEEIIYLNPRAIPIYKIRVNIRDKQKPYKAIQSFFAPTLGITSRSSAKERELRLMTRLRKMKVPELLCLLNPIFNVNFEKTALFKRLTEVQKNIATKKMIKQLCYGCFVVFWVMALENANNIDEESWPLFKEILDVDMCFILMTINTSFINKLSEDAKKVIHHHNARNIQLSPIDKWYHAGLACQILEVRAIPADLEKVIQIRSNGNPGWIESFLISLVQGGGLNIHKVLKETLNDSGLVVPFDEMLVRLSPTELRDYLLRDSAQNDGRGWKMYEFSYKPLTTQASFERLAMEKEKEGHPTAEICTISGTANIEDVDAELSLDVLIMKTYDSLSSYQQLLLKCSAVIGEMIPRDMLNYVMNQKNPRMTARAVQKLFEIRVLSCARGDFTQGDACVSFDMRLVNPNKDTAIKCDCKGIRIHETCLDLPKYASCGYFRFRLGAFRETTYNLLTDSQRKEFHGRAVRYLEKETRKETRKCKACGNAFFVRILGVRYDEGMKKKLKLQRASRKAQRSATNNMDLQKKTSQYSAATSSTGSPSRSQNVNISTGGDSKYSAVKKGSSAELHSGDDNKEVKIQKSRFISSQNQMRKRLVPFCKTKSKRKGVVAFLEAASDEERVGKIFLGCTDWERG
ncbi:Adenylate and Guanylate cyclase catalytic domain [Popillia japonica]|uniref:Adenylate and Guanylate cyclase catalytic domain n=1 Tax=Popillia japonica TaxID=7064 RepID=A0AAW1MIZ8_POPJA